MFSPSVFPSDDKSRLHLAYDGNPNEPGQEIFFDPQTGALVYGFHIELPKDDYVLVDTGMTMENVHQDFTAAGAAGGGSRVPLETMWQFATLSTAQEVERIIKNEANLPFQATTEITESNYDIFPTDKPMRSITVTNPDTGKSYKINAGLTAQAFGAALLVPEFKHGSYEVKYAPSMKLQMLRDDLMSNLT